MKRLICVLTALMLVLGGCQAAEAAPTAEELMAAVQESMEAGAYEEAEAALMQVLTMEPESYEANYALGCVYRALGDNEQAAEALKAAAEYAGENKEALYELSDVYLNTGEYQKAISALGGEAQGNTMAPEAAVALIAGYMAAGEYEKAITFFSYSSVQEYFMGLDEDEEIYFGGFDEAGQKQGRGVCMYEKGRYLYVGDYEAGIRSGSGIWMNGLRVDSETGLVKNSADDVKASYYQGEWANDMPNGEGAYYFMYSEEDGDYTARIGTYVDGLENGDMTIVAGEHSCPYEADMGVRKLNGYEYKMPDGSVLYYYALCEPHEAQCGENWTLKEWQLDAQWGISPWGAVKVSKPEAEEPAAE